MRIAITGISGRFGRLLASVLHREHTVVGIDRRDFPGPVDVEMHRVDLRRKRCESVFRNSEFQAVIHLHFVRNLRASSKEHHTFNIQGTTRVMEYCARYGVKKLILLSSANAYGPRSDNTQFLTEDAPLMGGERFSAIRDLVEMDMLGQSFFWKHSEVETVILRPAHIIGAVQNAASNYLRLRRPWVLAGFDPMVQLLHERDLAGAIELSLRPGVQGIFNIPGAQPAPLKHVLVEAGCEPVAMPHFVAGPLLLRMWQMRLTSFPAPELDHLRYVCMVDGQRARDKMGYEAQYGLDEILSYIRRSRLAHG